MTKTELVRVASEKAGITQAVALKALEGLLDGMKEAFGKGESVTMVGFGTLKVTSRAARDGRNPRTGEMIKIPAKKAVTFTNGKTLKESLNPPPPAKDQKKKK